MAFSFSFPVCRSSIKYLQTNKWIKWKLKISKPYNVFHWMGWSLVQVNVQYFYCNWEFIHPLNRNRNRSIVSSNRMRNATSIHKTHRQVKQLIKCKSKSAICIRTTISRNGCHMRIRSILFQCISVSLPFKWFIIRPRTENQKKVKWLFCDCARFFVFRYGNSSVASVRWSKNPLHKWFDGKNALSSLWWAND